jgi:hypothetical protein
MPDKTTPPSIGAPPSATFISSSRAVRQAGHQARRVAGQPNSRAGRNNRSNQLGYLSRRAYDSRPCMRRKRFGHDDDNFEAVAFRIAT